MAWAAACNNVARRGFKVVRSSCEGLGTGSRKKRAFRGDSEVRACPSPGFHASLAYWPLLVSCTPPAPVRLPARGQRDDKLGSIESIRRRGPEQAFWRSRDSRWLRRRLPAAGERGRVRNELIRSRAGS